jgi:hypothetical protein
MVIGYAAIAAGGLRGTQHFIVNWGRNCMAADRIRIADPPPAHCSSCFQARPTETHVDFGAFFDGPVIGEGVTRHVIDDLIICRTCLERAGVLVGLGNVVEVRDELQNAESENDRLMETVRGLKSYIAKLEAARDERPDELLDSPKRRRKVAA